MSVFDLNGDGYLDAADLNGDGLIDAVDTNGDGMIDAVDTNGDGVADLADLNGDGYLEQAGAVFAPSALDANGDGMTDIPGDPGWVDPAASLDPYVQAASSGPFSVPTAPAAQGTGIDVNMDGTIDGYDTDGDGWVDAVGPGAMQAAQAGPYPATSYGPADGPLNDVYTQSELNQGYSAYDTSFIEPARFADDYSMISDNDASSNL